MKETFFSQEEISWLGQFGTDRELALDLLRRIRRVSADEFQTKLTKLILERITDSATPVGLYAERSIRKWKGQPNRLFKEKGKPMRAHGVGPQPVKSNNTKFPETGSEGIVANIITQVTRSKPLLAFNHPGPDVIREQKIRRFILVADLIGSGEQAKRYLQSAWRIASVKSWKSGKFIDFEVVSFSAIAAGVKNLKNHPSNPRVNFVEACPTVFDYYNYGDKTLIDLCMNHGPQDYESTVPRLGFSDVGALIAFSHGMPNNAPRLLFKKGRKWTPLFAARVIGTGSTIGIDEQHTKAQAKLRRMGEKRLADLANKNGINSDQVLFFLVLSALKKKPRTIEIVSARTSLSIAECSNVFARCKEAGWIDASNTLTLKAHNELDYLRRPIAKKKEFPISSKPYYVPSQLRVPK